MYFGLMTSKYLSIIFVLIGCSKDDVGPTDCSTINIVLQSSKPPTGCDKSNGSVTFSVINGSAPFSYSLNTGSTTVKQTTPTFNNIFPGNLEITVADKNGCEQQLQFELRLPTLSGIKYSTQIKPILSADCNLATCHDGSLGSDRDWRSLGIIKTKLNNFQRVLSLKKMPPAPNAPLSDNDVSMILCWIADGAPDN